MQNLEQQAPKASLSSSNYRPIWTQTTEEVFQTAGSSTQGLPSAEAEQRLQHYGPNKLPEPPRRSRFLRFTDQLTHSMAMLVWVIARRRSSPPLFAP